MEVEFELLERRLLLQWHATVNLDGLAMMR